jgi:uncharacterized protein YbjT (DUF2867 family)
MTQKRVFVTGGTGNQGGAVVRCLLQRGYEVRVLTRNINSAKATELSKLNVEVVEGDLNDTTSYRDHLKDVYGIFSVQTFEHGVATEIKQGTDLARVAKEYEVGHFVYSSVAGADLHTGIPHWDSKYRVEQYIKDLGLPYTIIRPTSLFENFLIPQVKSRLVKGKLVSPVKGDVVQQFVSSVDVGKIGALMFDHPDTYIRRTITLAAEQMNLKQAATCFSEVMGRAVKYEKLPGVVTRLAMGKKLYKMFKWVNEHGGVFVKDMETVNSELPPLMSLRRWISINFGTNRTL